MALNLFDKPKKSFCCNFFYKAIQQINFNFEVLHRIIIYGIMLVDTSMYKINPITKIQNIVLKNLLDTRYRQRNKRKEKKYDRKRDKNVRNITPLI